MEVNLKFLVPFLLLGLVGCGSKLTWRVQQLPITQEERDAIDKHVKEVLRSNSNASVKQVYEQARISLIKPRYFEYSQAWDGYLVETGRWRELTEVK